MTINEIFDEIKRRPIAIELLKKVNHGAEIGYECICDGCTGGTGKHGTGATLYAGNTRLGCFTCKENGRHGTFTNVDVIAYHIGLSVTGAPITGADALKVAQFAADYFGLTLDGYSSPVKKNEYARPEISPSPANHAAAAEAALKAKTAEIVAADIAEYLEGKRGSKDVPQQFARAIESEMYERFHVVYDPQWTTPQSRAKGTYCTPTARIIFICGNFYFARLADKIDDYPAESHKYIHRVENAGEVEIFNGGVIDTTADAAHIYVTEGEIDAISLMQATGLDAVVAIHGTPHWRKLLDRILARSDGGKNLAVNILFDDDNAGWTAAKEFQRALIANGIPAIVRFLPRAAGDTSDEKVDANQILQKFGADALRESFLHALDGSGAEFLAVEEEIAHRADSDSDTTVNLETDSDTIKFSRADEEKNNSSANVNYIPDTCEDLIFNQIHGVNDLANARRFTAVEGDKFKFLSDTDRWLIYTGPLMPLVVDAYDKIIAAAGTDTAKLKIAAPFGNQRHVAPMLAYVKGLARVTLADLDRHPHLLNCQNGVVDLQTGDFFEHDTYLQKISSWLITQQVNAEYRAGYRNEIVEKFLHDIQPDENDLLALQIFFGYGASGETNVEKFLFLKGGGGNGKGTLTGAILKTLGSYSTPFPIRGILKSKNVDGNTATTALNTLAGKRLGISDEIPKNAKVDLGTLKILTGGDEVPMRRLHEEYATVAPTWKLIFSGNDPLLVDDVSDYGFIRRFLYLPFTQSFGSGKANLALKQMLSSTACRAGLLSWLVDGAREYYRRNDIYVSPTMTAAAKSYLAEQDWLGDFVSEHCERNDGYCITLADFLKQLKENCTEANRYSKPSLIEMIKKIDGTRYEPRYYDAERKKQIATIFGLRWWEEK